MATLEELIVKISADNAEFRNALSDVERQVSKLSGNVGGQTQKISQGFRGLTSSVTALGAALAGAALGAGFKSLIDSGKDLEKARFGLAGLINATTQFSTAQGRALNPVENLNASVNQANKLYGELRKQATLLADIETPELLANATIALPTLNVIGVTEAAQQAELIGTITASIKQLGIATNEIEAKKELQAFLTGNVTGAGVEFAKLVAQVNGGTEAFKANYQQAVQNGTAYEFLKNSLLAFRASSELSATTLSNQFSVFNDSVNIVTSTIGEALLPATKELVQTGIDQFFTKGKDGALSFNKELEGTAKEIGTNFGNAIKSLEPLVKPVFDLMIASLRLVAGAFGETGTQGKSEIETLAGVIAKAADVVNFLADRVGSLVQVFRGTFQLAQAAAAAGMGFIVGQVQSRVNAMIGIINVLGKAFAGVFNFVAGGLNALGANIQQVKFDVPKVNLVKGLGLDKASAGKAAKEGLNNLQAGFKGLVGQVKPTKLPKGFFDTSSALSNLKSTSKAAPSADGGKQGKGKSGKGEAAKAARDAQGAQFAQFESQEQARLNQLKLAELNIEKQINNLKTAANAGDVELKKQQSQNELAKAQLENEKLLAENSFQKRENEIKQQLSLGQITKQQSTQKLNDLNNEKAASDLLLANKATELQYAGQLATLENTRKDLENQKLIAIQTANAQQVQKVGALQAESANLQQQLTYLQQHQGTKTQIAEVQNKLVANENAIKQATIDINAQLSAKLATIGQELGLNTTQIQNLQTMLGLEKERNAIQSQNTAQQDKFTAACGETNKSMDILKQGAQSVGNALSSSISDAIKTGEFDLKKFGSSILDTFLNIASQLATTALGGLFGGGGGLGGGLGSLFGGAFAKGGIAPANRLSLVGENGPELIAPTRASRIYSNKDSLAMTQGGGGGQQVVIQVTAMDSQDTIRALSKPEVQKLLGMRSNEAYSRASNQKLNRSTFERQAR